ncbi:ABC transporter substrate-binding protein [Goodfellowiella coeruleoviolacea]|uniref:Carbohydrate ABC transporter substrate-binding protein, CUT1 family (TC 3.A.1.1.-) n=1 Tax=Goodfellowiella coeruleoviolacea TaxID=334858 RepID=A0AAE3KGQ1_9PSEU|nr:sugar ABC transporter substrate-binding protein [Goodfellowiella coeruleoviolacea]MCP2166445.1 carbohydrate ABC transporter substrate-binding protein, CUT1 family (TC 3.A.1.1.-) [Goodfellowiella coeruleoviolacea]
MVGPRGRGARSRALLGAVWTVVLVGCLALSGCGGFFGGGSSAGTGKTTITFWDNNGGPDRTPLWEHVIAEFEKQQPDIHVEYVGIPISQVQQKYDTAIAGGGLPDVGGVSTAYLAGMTAQQALEPLDERLSTSGLNGKLVKGLVDSMRAAGGDDKLYAVPTSSNNGVFWYRKDWFAEAGLEPPQTWDQFYDVVGKLTDKTRNRYGFTIRGGPGSIPQVLEVMYGYSGIRSIFDEQGRATVNDPRNVEAVQKLVSLYNTATPTADVNNDYPKMVAQFDGGSVAIMQHNLGSYRNHKDSLGADNVVGAPVFPSPVTTTRNVLSNPVDGVGVFRTSKNKDAAWKFVEFAASAPMNSYWTEKAGVLPANTDVSSESWVREAQPLRDATAVLNDPATNVVQLPYYLPQLNPILKTDMEPVFQKVMLGQLPAKDFLDQFAQKLNDAQADWTQHSGGR